jgi:hypothetical protein
VKEMADGYTESVTIDEGVNEQGVRTQFHFESDGGIVLQKTFDAAPILKEAEAARQATDGMNWGEGRVVGTIDPVAYGRISKIRDRQERDKAILDYFREKPQFVKFNPYYKTLFGVRK